MKNKFIRVFSIIGLVIATSSLCISCNPEDGVSGLNGVDGENGIIGENGENGIGFDNLVKYGSISLTMTGTRPDNNAAFTSTTDLKFNPTELGQNDIYDYDTEDSDIEYYFTRFKNTPDSRENSSITLELDVSDDSPPELVISFNQFSVLFEDLAYIEFRSQFYGSVENNFSISGYSFDETTNNLKFSFTFDTDNDIATGENLTISGDVDVILFKQIEAVNNI